jgi:PLP dependent protein
MVAENVQKLRQRIVSHCTRVGRNPAEVILIAVSKTVSVELLRKAVDAGIYDIGENYVQEMEQKHDALQNEKIRWHFIGHLQTNKVKYIIEWIHLIHSVDSLALGQEISKRAERAKRTVDILVEVNTSGEENKFGVSPLLTCALVKDLVQLPNINIAGLMTMGPFFPNPEDSRPAFRTLRELKQIIERDGIPLRHLSMGMSNDFEIAIDEGATIVRVGTAIFGPREKPQSTIGVGR